jgi:hypothetical protein
LGLGILNHVPAFFAGFIFKGDNFEKGIFYLSLIVYILMAAAAGYLYKKKH